jgi:hypothetical protein
MPLTGGFGSDSSQSGLFYSSVNNSNSIFPTYDDQIITTTSGLHTASGIATGVSSSIITSDTSMHNPSGIKNPHSNIPARSPAGSGIATDHTSQSGVNRTSVGIDTGYPTIPPSGFDPDAPSTLPGSNYTSNIGAPDRT